MAALATLLLAVSVGRPAVVGRWRPQGLSAAHVPLSAPARRSLGASMLETISRDKPAPAGPNPYKLVESDLEHIKTSIKKVLSDNRGGSSAISKNEVLTMAAREFMQRKGKSFRPMVVLLVGRATNPDFTIGNRHYKLAVIAEMIHTASLIHADVLEEDETDTSQGTLVHQEVALDVGNKASTGVGQMGVYAEGGGRGGWSQMVVCCGAPGGRA
jgi:hypothetical protein